QNEPACPLDERALGAAAAGAEVAAADDLRRVACCPSVSSCAGGESVATAPGPRARGAAAHQPPLLLGGFVMVPRRSRLPVRGMPVECIYRTPSWPLPGANSERSIRGRRRARAAPLRALGLGRTARAAIVSPRPQARRAARLSASQASSRRTA